MWASRNTTQLFKVATTTRNYSARVSMKDRVRNGLFVFPILLIVALVSCAEAAPPAGNDSNEEALQEAIEQGARIVTDRWTWLREYGSIYSKWTVQCPTARRCQVGMGVKMGDPLGEKIRFSGKCEFITVGFGSIHVRVADGKGPCPVILHSGSAQLIPIFFNKKF